LVRGSAAFAETLAVDTYFMVGARVVSRTPTLARRSGMDIKDLSVRLGHENVATTMNLYQHIPVDMARESAQTVADYILG
jgi:integrase